MDTHKRKIKAVYAAAIVLLLMCVFVYLLATISAKNITQGAGKDSARNAAWTVATVYGGSREVNILADSEYGEEYYSFTIKPGENSEIASEYDVKVTLKNGEEAITWPEAVTAKITDDEGVTVQESATGEFNNLGSFAPGGTGEKKYRLYLKATEAVEDGDYGIEVKVRIRQKT